jgi:hypothetical protein
MGHSGIDVQEKESQCFLLTVSAACRYWAPAALD